MSVVAAIEPTLLTVEPGGSASVTVRVRNLGLRVDKFELTVLGPMARWAAVEPPALRLFPSTEAEATVTFKPPRASQPPSGEYPFGVKAQSVSDPDGSTVEEGDVRVGPFVATKLEVVPRVSRDWRRGRHTLTITNTGNERARFGVEAVDPEERVRLTAEPSEVEVEPGTSRSVQVRATATGFTIRGPERRWPFTIVVTPPSAASESITASFAQRALVPGWLMAMAGVILALALGPAIIAWATGGGASGTASPPVETDSATPSPGPTAQATPTPTSEVTPSPTPEVSPTPEPTVAWPQVPTITIDGDAALNGTFRAHDQFGRDDFGVLVVIISAEVHGTTCDLELAWDADLPAGEHPFGDEVQGTFICPGFSETVFSSRGTLYLLERTDSVTGTFDFFADDRAGGAELHLTGGFVQVFIVPPIG